MGKIDPLSRFELVLSRHAERDPAPTFVFKGMSSRQRRELLERFIVLDQNANAANTADPLAAQAFLDGHLDIIKGQLVDWRHMTDEEGEPIDFNRDDLDRVVTDFDVMELRARLVVSNMLSAQEKKASASPSPSSTVEAAPDAAPAASV